MHTNRFLAALVCVGIGGCSGPAEPAQPDYARQALDVRQALDAEFADTDSITFRSWDGKWIGTDCDAEIELKADGTAVLTEYSVAVQKYAGTYAIGNRTTLSLALQNYANWPPMYLLKDGSALLLVPTDSSLGFVSRGSATIPGDAGSFWPFRQLPADADDGGEEQ